MTKPTFLFFSIALGLNSTQSLSQSYSFKQVYDSYEVMASHIGGTIAVYETCVNDKRQTTDIRNALRTEFKNWGQRHSYADQIKNSVYKNLSDTLGPSEAKKVIENFVNRLESELDDLKKMYQKNYHNCPQFLLLLSRRQAEFHVLQKKHYQILVSSLN